MSGVSVKAITTLRVEVLLSLLLPSQNAFDIEKFLSTKLKLKPEEEFEVFDAGAAAGSESA